MPRLTILFALFASIIMGFASPLHANATSELRLQARTTHQGRATWFNVGLGNCGDWNSDNDPILAISILRYGNGGNCNQWVKITNHGNGNVAYAKTRDSCQSCGEDDIDLSPDAFQQLAALSVGQLTVSWNFMAMDWAP